MSVDRFGRFFSSLEILEVTGLSDRRFYYWIDQGYLQSAHKRTTGSGKRWSFPYFDVLQFDLAAKLTDSGLEVAEAFTAVTTLDPGGLPFDGSYLATTADQGWTVTTHAEPTGNQLLHISIDLETAVTQLNTRIDGLTQGTLPF